MNKQPLITEETRRNLLTAFWKLYEDRKINEISIKEITYIAGYHRATFYLYYKNIYDLLLQEESNLIKQIEVVSHSVSDSDKFENMLLKIADFYKENFKKLSLLIGPTGDPEFFSKFKTSLFPVFQQTRAIPDTDESLIIFEFGISGLIMALNSWYSRQPAQPIDVFLKIMHSVIEMGIPRSLEEIKNIQ